MDLPVIVGVSEGERDHIGVRQAMAIIESIRQERDQPIFINADHTYSFERVVEAIDAGYDSVIFDGAKLSFEENVQTTRKCVEYARKNHRTANTGTFDSAYGTLIEGELGFIGSSSKILDAIPAGAVVGESQMTLPEDAARFVRETGVDMLAPAVGNIHGVVRGGDPALDIERVSEISRAVDLPLVLHGASGNSADDIKMAIKNGMAVVHVSTELRIAYRAGLTRSLSDDLDELSPYKYMKPAKLAMQRAVEEKLGIFS